MNKPFSAWREGAPYYLPLLIAGPIVQAILWPSIFSYAGAAIFASGLFVAFFFRDVPRTIPTDPNAVVSPADGKIVAIEDLTESPHYTGPCRRVSIFLSTLSVHVNRIPYTGTITNIVYQKGKFSDPGKASSTHTNESNTIHVDTGRGDVAVRQIAGWPARRIVCIPKVGDKLAKGEKYGMIKLGSRTELYLPPGTEVCVKVKSRVSGGATIVARL